MTAHPSVNPADADTIRALNQELDREILAVDVSEVRLDAVPDLREPDGAVAWSAAQVLAHLGEFPHFFATELRRWHNDPAQVVGRTHADPTRLAAVAKPASQADQLRRAVVAAFDDLADALGLLVDEDIESVTNNAKYGAEPLSSFLDRYVLGHKRGHLDQLRRTVAAVAVC